MLKKIAAAAVALCAIITYVFPFYANADEIKPEEGFIITDLRVNDLDKPCGISVENPSFSWKMKSSETGAEQSAYRIKVAKDKDFNEITEDTGKTESSVSVAVRTENTANLESFTEYFWTVTVWDNKGNEKTSDVLSFTTGIKDDSDFSSSEWISAKKKLFRKNKGISTFRKEIGIEKELESAYIYCSALGVFDVYINGERAGTETDGKMVYDELKPGYTHYPKHAIYYTYDISSLMENEVNTVCAQVSSGWWSGAVSGPFWASLTDKFFPALNFSYGKKEAFRAEIRLTYKDGTTETIGTDTTWKASFEGPVTYGDIYGGETFDANADISCRYNGFDDSSWKNAVINNEFKGNLIPLLGSPVRQIAEITPVYVTVYEGCEKKTRSQYGKITVVNTPETEDSFTLAPGQTAVVDMGQNFAGIEEITVKGENNTEIILRHGEMLNDCLGIKERGNDGPEGSIYTANLRRAKAQGKYIMKGGESETYRASTTFYGYRYLEITADKPVTIEKVRGVVLSSVNHVTGSIKTSDEDLNRLISNILWGQYSNYLSVPTDCPQRDERKGWTADAQVFSGAACYNADSKGFLTQYLTALDDSRIEGGKYDGAYPDTAPYNRYGEIGQLGWSDAGIIIPFNLYKMYGDTSVIEKYYDGMVKYMDVFMASTNKLGGGHNHGDWLAYESNDDEVQNIFGTAYYAMDAGMMSYMADAIGKKDDAEKYLSVYEDEKAFFIENFVNEDGSLIRTEQTACLLALRAGLLPDKNSEEKVKQALIDNIERNGNKLQTGFLGTAVILEVLSDIGANDTAYKVLLQHDNPSWLYSVDNGATTVWERWNSYTKEDGFGDVRMNSFNHYAYGAVANWMYAYMGGIRYDPENPGFRHFILKPCPNKSLSFADVSYESVYGKIISSWKYDSQGFVYDIEIPANTSASVFVPAESENITVNGVALSGLEDKNIEYKGYNDGRAEFIIGSGTYTFVCR